MRDNSNTRKTPRDDRSDLLNRSEFPDKKRQRTEENPNQPTTPHTVAFFHALEKSPKADYSSQSTSAFDAKQPSSSESVAPSFYHALKHGL